MDTLFYAIGSPQLMSLKLEDVGAQRSFLFLWCGSCEGLDLGREVYIYNVSIHNLMDDEYHSTLPILRIIIIIIMRLTLSHIMHNASL